MTSAAAPATMAAAVRASTWLSSSRRIAGASSGRSYSWRRGAAVSSSSKGAAAPSGVSSSGVPLSRGPLRVRRFSGSGVSPVSALGSVSTAAAWAYRSAPAASAGASWLMDSSMPRTTFIVSGRGPGRWSSVRLAVKPLCSSAGSG